MPPFRSRSYNEGYDRGKKREVEARYRADSTIVGITIPAVENKNQIQAQSLPKYHHLTGSLESYTVILTVNGVQSIPIHTYATILRPGWDFKLNIDAFVAGLIDGITTPYRMTKKDARLNQARERNSNARWRTH